MEEIELTFYAEKRADGWYVRMAGQGIPDRFEGPMRSREVAMKHIDLFLALNFNKVDPNESAEPIIIVRKAPAVEVFVNILMNMRSRMPSTPIDRSTAN